MLTALAPETSDVEFTWQDFMDRVNNELVANWGNLVNRVLGFAYKRFDGRVPAPGELDAVDQALLEEIRAGFDTVGELYDAVKLKAALTEARRLEPARQPVSEREGSMAGDQRGPGGCGHDPYTSRCRRLTGSS